MKLEKLLTLSQFVDWITDPKGCRPMFPSNYIVKYNNFLKQSLTKDYAIELMELNNGLIYLDDENYPGCVLLKKGCSPFGFLMSDLAEATKGELLINLEL